VQSAIESVLEPEGKQAPSGQPAPQRRSWILPAAIVAAIVLVAAVAFFFKSQSRDSTEATPKKEAPSPVLATSTGEMVLIPAGATNAFYIDRTEVSNEAYARFCEERRRPLPPGFPQSHPDYPVVNITIVEAGEFAKWAQKRIPTKLEWETAARGSDKRAYPWGNAHDPSLANVKDNPASNTGSLMAVGAFKQGASPYGVLQMAGNAWEFVDELITPSNGAMQAFAAIMTPPPAADEPWYTIRGGAYDVPLVENAAFEWSAVPARFRASNIGFRCVKDVK